MPVWPKKHGASWSAPALSRKSWVSKKPRGPAPYHGRSARFLRRGARPAVGFSPGGKRAGVAGDARRIGRCGCSASATRISALGNPCTRSPRLPSQVAALESAAREPVFSFFAWSFRSTQTIVPHRRKARRNCPAQIRFHLQARSASIRGMKIITDERCTGYSSRGHPERPERVARTLCASEEIPSNGSRPARSRTHPVARPMPELSPAASTDFDGDTPARIRLTRRPWPRG